MLVKSENLPITDTHGFKQAISITETPIQYGHFCIFKGGEQSVQINNGILHAFPHLT